MGYYTQFTLKIDAEKDVLYDIAVFLKESEEYDFILPMWNDWTDSVKWYSSDEDMKLISKKFPSALFTLNGEGEESGDVWVAYFKNGKMQKEVAVINLAPYDESKLK